MSSKDMTTQEVLLNLTAGSRVYVNRFGQKRKGTFVRTFQPINTYNLFAIEMDLTGEILDVPWYDLEPFSVEEGDPVHESESTRFVKVDVNKFICDQENKETARKTKSNLNLLNEFLSSVGETRQIYNIEPVVLSNYLSQFVLSVRKQNGEDYEPNSLRGFISSFERYLRHNEYGFSIITSLEFSKTRDSLKAKQIQLKKEGKGNKPFKSDPITDVEIWQLYDSGELGRSTPDSVLNTLWLNNSTHFGLRGVKEHRQLQWGDIKLKSVSLGREYIEYSCERQTKTRTGVNPRDTRTVNPRMYATGCDRCPVDLYKFYADKRSAILKSDDSPFYVAPKSRNPRSNDIWYKNQCVGVNKIAGIMKSMKSAAGLTGQTKLTNTSARKYLTQKLVDNKVPPTEVMQITGHKNVQSILNYSSLSEQRQMEISTIIDTPALSTGFEIVPGDTPSTPLPPASFSAAAGSSNVSSFSSQEHSFTSRSGIGSLFSGCTITGGTVNINISLPHSEEKRAKLDVSVESEVI